MTETNRGPLAGIRVIDLTTVVLGPFATQILGDMGADVIKVEAPRRRQLPLDRPEPHRRGWARYFVMLNRNKRSIVLDLKQPGAARGAAAAGRDGRRVRAQHAARRGRAAGLGYASLPARNPRLVYACASGFRKGSSDAGDARRSTT